MGRCQIKTGFMILRDCENYTDTSCSVCGKAVCSKHQRNYPGSNEICCIDCYGRAINQSKRRVSRSRGGASLFGSGLFEDDYWYNFRNLFYNENGYRPFSMGSNPSIFGEGEVRAFDPKNNVEDKENLDNVGNEDNVFDS